MKTHYLSYDAELFPSAIMLSNDALYDYEIRMQDVGTKDDPSYWDMSGHYHHIDGISAEMAPRYPLRSAHEAMTAFVRAKEVYERVLGTQLTGMDWIDIAEIPGFSEANVPWLYSQVNTFGCSPDYVNGRRRSVPQKVRDTTVRELGMHLHFDLRPEFRDTRSRMDIQRGVEPTNVESVAKFAREFAQTSDFLFDAAHPSQRLWYRVPGLYRPTSYGMEYRTFGSSVCNDPDRMLVLFNLAEEFMRDHFSTEGKAVFL